MKDLFYGLFNYGTVPPFAIVTREICGIEKPSDLKVKTLGVAQGTPQHALPCFSPRSTGQLTWIKSRKKSNGTNCGTYDESADIDAHSCLPRHSWFQPDCKPRQDPANDYNWVSNFETNGWTLYSTA